VNTPAIPYRPLNCAIYGVRVYWQHWPGEVRGSHSIYKHPASSSAMCNWIVKLAEIVPATVLAFMHAEFPLSRRSHIAVTNGSSICKVCSEYESRADCHFTAVHFLRGLFNRLI
jgi:hypothetical protein